MKFRNGLASLLRPEDSVLVLIDHQPYQLSNLNSHVVPRGNSLFAVSWQQKDGGSEPTTPRSRHDH